MAILKLTGAFMKQTKQEIEAQVRRQVVSSQVLATIRKDDNGNILDVITTEYYSQNAIEDFKAQAEVNRAEVRKAIVDKEKAFTDHFDTILATFENKLLRYDIYNAFNLFLADVQVGARDIDDDYLAINSWFNLHRGDKIIEMPTNQVFLDYMKVVKGE